jgi:hypothetical protein
VAETRASTENLKRDSPSGYSGVIGTSSMPLHKRKNGALIHDESGTSSGLAQRPGCVAASGETRRIPRVPPLSFCGAAQGGVPDDLIKLWLGHSQNLMDLYTAQLRYDETYRREWCEKAGLGFGLGELGYNWEAPIRPSLVA